MLRVLAIAALFALALPTFAFSQEHRDEHGGPPPHGGGPPHPPPGPPPRPAVVPHGPPPGAMVPHGPPPGAMVPHGPPPGAMAPHPPGPPAAFVRPGGGPPGVHFSYHGHDMERVHRDPFLYPPGFAYRRWAVGAALPPIFLTPDYYYPEWAALGLEPPPPGTQWVRYGPDLLLVDVRTGQVLDTAYDVFY